VQSEGSRFPLFYARQLVCALRSRRLACSVGPFSVHSLAPYLAEAAPLRYGPPRFLCSDVLSPLDFLGFSCGLLPEDLFHRFWRDFAWTSGAEPPLSVAPGRHLRCCADTPLCCTDPPHREPPCRTRAAASRRNACLGSPVDLS